MACYYFHFTDGKITFKDAAGVELPGLVEAHQEAIRCAQFLMRPQPEDVHELDWSSRKVVIATEESAIVELPFAAIRERNRVSIVAAKVSAGSPPQSSATATIASETPDQSCSAVPHQRPMATASLRNCMSRMCRSHRAGLHAKRAP
jgi:hypothetical protein